MAVRCVAICEVSRLINVVERGAKSGNTLIVVHGLGEHIGRYERLFREASERGYRVLGFDLPGHGKSEGIRGHSPIKKTMRIIENLSKDLKKPPVIFGHSLGGLIAIRYVELGGKVSGLVASSPALSFDRSKVHGGLVALAKFLSLIVPFLTMDNRIDPRDLSRNEEAVKAYVSDPMVHRRVSIKLARDLFVESVRALEHAQEISVPTLVVIGTQDRITPPDGARKFYHSLGTDRKKLIEYEGAFHEIFEDPEYSDKFYEDLFDFLKGLEVNRWEDTER